MNIFVLSCCAATAAEMHCDKHFKLILEATQILYTYLHTIGITLPPGVDGQGNPLKVYGKTHQHHPCTLWLHGGRAHFEWLLTLGLELCTQYTLIFEKTYACEHVLLHMLRHVDRGALPDNCDVAVWLQRLANFGESGETLQSCAAKAGKVHPPEGCAFGVVVIGDDLAPTRDANGNIDVTDSYGRYYFEKSKKFHMKWGRVCVPPPLLINYFC